MIASALRLSLIVASIATPLIAALGIAFGYILAKHRFRAKELLDALLTLPMVLPPTVTGYYLILLVGRRGLIGGPVYELTGWTVTFTWMAAVIASTIIALPIMVRSARAAIESVDPLFEIASLTLGKSRTATFFHITLPLARRGIWAGIVLSFARAFGEFGATLMLAGNIPGRTQTMPLAIYEAVVSGEDAQAKWLALILTGISVVVVYFTNHLTRTEKSS
jgi:molybdate transport system permease protein